MFSRQKPILKPPPQLITSLFQTQQTCISTIHPFIYSFIHSLYCTFRFSTLQNTDNFFNPNNEELNERSGEKEQGI